MTCSCKDNLDYLYFLPDANDAGWRCSNCSELLPGTPPGYRPDIDKDLILTKVEGLVQDLRSLDLIYVSNSTDGGFLSAKVADRCVAEGNYSMYYILYYVFDELK